MQQGMPKRSESLGYVSSSPHDGQRQQRSLKTALSSPSDQNRERERERVPTLIVSTPVRADKIAQETRA